MSDDMLKCSGCGTDHLAEDLKPASRSKVYCPTCSKGINKILKDAKKQT